MLEKKQVMILKYNFTSIFYEIIKKPIVMINVVGSFHKQLAILLPGKSSMLVQEKDDANPG